MERRKKWFPRWSKRTKSIMWVWMTCPIIWTIPIRGIFRKIRHRQQMCRRVQRSFRQSTICGTERGFLLSAIRERMEPAGLLQRWVRWNPFFYRSRIISFRWIIWHWIMGFIWRRTMVVSTRWEWHILRHGKYRYSKRMIRMEITKQTRILRL